MRWVGHTIITAAITAVVVERLHKPLNWFTVVIALAFMLLLTSVWLTRKRDPIMEAAPDAHRVTKKEHA